MSLKTMVCFLLFGTAVAVSAPVITPIIVTEHPEGTYKFPLAPVLHAGHSRSDLCYHHSEYTANTTGSDNIALCDSTAYIWTISAIGSTQDASIDVYCTEAFGGGDPSLAAPTNVAVDGVIWFSMTCGALSPGSWCYGDPDSDGYNQICVAMLDQDLPDPDDASYASDDTVTAVYGQGAHTNRYCTTGEYEKSSGILTCSGNFLLYGFVAEDRILIEHAEINAGTPTWVEVASKTSADAIVVPSGLGTSATLSNVKIYSHMDPFHHNRPVWTMPDAIYSYQQTDDRHNAASTTISSLQREHPWTFAPLLASNGFGTRSEDVEFKIYDDLHGISSATETLTYDDEFWVGARVIYIGSTGTDCSNCLTTACGTGCTSGSPCLTWRCGISQLVRTSGPAILAPAQGETFDLCVGGVGADVTFAGGDTDDKWIDGTLNGSGADPIIDAQCAGTDENALSGTTTNLRINNIVFDRTAGSGDDTLNPTLNKSLMYRCTVNEGSGQSALDIDGYSYALLDNVFQTTYPVGGSTYPLYSMGGDGISAWSVRWRVFRGNDVISTRQTHTNMRVRCHECAVLDHHNEYVEEGSGGSGTLLRFAHDNHPHYQMSVDGNALIRTATGTVDTPSSFAITPQNSGRSDHLLFTHNDVRAATPQSLTAIDPSPGYAIGVRYARVDNNTFHNHGKLWSVGTASGGHLSFNGNTFSGDHVQTLNVFNVPSSVTGYSNVWILNSIINVPNAGNPGCLGLDNPEDCCSGVGAGTCSTNRQIDFNGSGMAVGRVHIHKTIINRGPTSGTIRIGGTGYSVASYETARTGLDILGGASAEDMDPKLVDLAGGDLRICTGTDTPEAGCVVSPAFDAGFALAELYDSYDGTVRPVGAEYDIGAFEMDESTGRCYECDGTCTDGFSEAECDILMGDYDDGMLCAGDAPVGACCETSSSADCTSAGDITDFCCTATQWLAGDTCADCEWKCCERDGTCSEVSEAVCAADTFYWGLTCGTCPTVACCTDAVTCEDLTAEACLLENKLPGAGGSVCGVGDPCAALFPATLNARMNLLGVGR